MYILFHLEPSTEVTGGPWYTDKELDTEFIKLLSAACLKFIRDRVRLHLDYHARTHLTVATHRASLEANQMPIKSYYTQFQLHRHTQRPPRYRRS